MPKLVPIADPFAKPTPAPAPAARKAKLTPIADPFVDTSAVGAFRRKAQRNVLPALGGAAGFGAGFATAGTLAAPAAAVPVAGPFITGGAALLGGLLGAFGGGALVEKAQEGILSVVPDSVRTFVGQAPAQVEADTRLNPLASFAGELAPGLLTGRPTLRSVPVQAGASKLARFVANPAGGAAVGASLSSGIEGARQYTAGEFDAGRLALAAGAGALQNKPTTLGSQLFEVGGNTAIRVAKAGTNTARKATDIGIDVLAKARDARDIRSGALIENPPQPIRPQPSRVLAPVTLKPIDDPFTAPVTVENVPPVAPPAPAGAVAAIQPALPAPIPQTVEPVAVTAPGPPVLHGNDMRPDPGELADGEHYVTTPAGNRIRSRYEVVDASTLRAAEGDLQNRDRSRDTTDLQVQDIVAQFDPTRLGPSAETDRGAPIVGPDNIVESGNGRMLALNRIQTDPANAEKAAAYRAFIEGQGLSTEGIANPVLIRRRANDLTPEQRRQFVIDSNKDAKLALTSVERARSDADALDGDSLALYRGGDIGNAGNADFVKAFNGRLTKSELASQIDGSGQISQDGIVRIENALMARAYENPQVLSKLIEARDNNIRSIGAGLLDNAAPWARLRADVKEGRVHPEYDVTPQLVEAARRVSDLRASGGKIGDELSQVAMFEAKDPIVESFMRAFYNPELTRAASREAVSAAIAKYTRRAAEQTTEEKLFGGDETTPLAILEDVLRERTEGDTGSLFDAPTQETGNGNEANGQPQRDEGGNQRVARQGQKDEAGARRTGGEGEGGNANRGGEGKGRGGGLTEQPAAADYTPKFNATSFTNRKSLFDSAAVALGLDPDKFALLAAPRQVALLKGLMDKTFGVTIEVDKGMQERFAIDQMLDAYQNVRGMAYILGLPEKAIGFDGKLSLRLQKGGNYLGVFFPAKMQIALPKRSNSFAHEWGHALDFWLLDQMTPELGRGLSGAVRDGGGSIMDGPKNVGQAFARMMQTMFDDKAAVALKIMELERKLAATNSPKVKEQTEAQIERLKDGNSQSQSVRSNYYKGAKQFGAIYGPKGYWQSPTEMMARAFEAYVSHRAELEGLDTALIGKGDAAYLSTADDRLAMTFPKQEERNDIFSAFDDLMTQIAKEQMIAKGSRSAKPGAGRSPRQTPEQRRGSMIQRLIDNELGPIQDARTSRDKFVEGRAASGRSFGRKVRDVAAYFAYGMTAELRAIGKVNNSPTIAKLHTMLEWTTGNGKATQRRGFIQASRMREAQLLNRVGKAYDDYAPRSGITNRPRMLTKAEDLQLRDLLISEAGVVAPDNIKRLAAELRSIEDDTFYLLQRVGVDVGYTRNGHLMRMLDMGIIANDGDGFKEAGTKVYGIMFDNEFPPDGGELIDAGKLPSFIAIAKKAARTDPSFVDELKTLVEAAGKMHAVLAAIKEAEDPAKLKAQLPALKAAVVDALDELHPLVRASVSEFQAQAWATKLGEAADYEFPSVGPSTDFLKGRTMPPEADKILEKYYINDPRQVVETYLKKAARLIEYAGMFGHDHSKINAMLKQMAAEGVPKVDIETVKKIFDLSTGRAPRSEAHPSVTNAMSMLKFIYGTAALLPRATFSSMSEALTAGIVMGDAKYGLKAFGSMVGQIMHTASAAERREIAAIAGFVHETSASQVMAERFGGTVDETKWDRLATAMFRNSGLTWLTKMQHTGMIAPAHAFLASLARGYLKGTPNGIKEATARFNELGITDIDGFAKRIAAQKGYPAASELESATLEPEKYRYAHDWMTAVGRMKSQVVQEPSVMSRPRAASTATGQFVYGIMSFNYEQWRNVIRGEMNRAWERAERSGSAYSAAYAAFALLPAVALVVMGAIVTTTIREATTNYARFKERLDNGTLLESMTWLGIQRAFGTPFDPVVQAMGGTKYNRAPFLQLLGSTLGNIGQNVSDIATQFTSNTRTSNATEHNAVRGIYRMLSPWGVAALSAVPGGPVLNFVAGAVAGTITSPQAGETAGDLLVGKKNGRKIDGKRVKSGPSAFDRMLNEAFGKPPKKERAKPLPIYGDNM